MWSVTVFGHYAVGEGAVVDTDAKGGMVLMASVDERSELLYDEVVPLLVGHVVGVGVEAFGFACVVARVYAYGFDESSCRESGFGVEVDVGDERGVAVVAVKSFADLADAACFALSLGCQSDEFSASVDDFETLGRGVVDVVGVGCRHGLDANWRVAAHGEVADFYLSGLLSDVFEERRRERCGCMAVVWHGLVS